MVRRHWALLFPVLGVVFYISALSRFWGVPPDLDAMVNLRESLQFCDTGLSGLLAARGGGSHPPLLYALNCVAFKSFGFSPGSSNFAGTLLYLGIVFSTFQLFKKLSAAWIAGVVSLFVAVQPFVVIHTFYPMNEALMCLIYLWLLSALLSQRTPYIFALCFVAAFVKSTFLGLILPPLLVYTIADRKLWVRRLACTFVPLILGIAAWNVALFASGGHAWNSEIKGTAETNPYLIIIERLLKFEFADVYFQQNIVNGLVLNFAWVPAIFSLLALLYARPKLQNQWCLFVALVSSASVGYTILALSFPTWTIPRYSMPLNFCCLLLSGALVVKLVTISNQKTLALIAAILLATAGVAGTLDSNDHVTLFFAPSFKLYGARFYSIAYNWRGPDRVDYNVQFAKASRAQEEFIEAALQRDADYIVTDCFSLKLREKLYSMQSFYGFRVGVSFNKTLSCLGIQDIAKQAQRAQLVGKKGVVASNIPLSNLGLNVVGRYDFENGVWVE